MKNGNSEIEFRTGYSFTQRKTRMLSNLFTTFIIQKQKNYDKIMIMKMNSIEQFR